MAVEAEELINQPYSPAWKSALGQIKPHMDLGRDEIMQRWRKFILVSMEDQFLAKNRSVRYFASNINSEWSAQQKRKKRREYD
jgi:hypothetical protein